MFPRPCRAHRRFFTKQPARDQSLYRSSPFSNNTIPTPYLDPTGLAIAALYPLPNRNVPNQNYVSSPDGRLRDDQFDLRLDHSLTAASDQLTFRYSFADNSLFEPFTGPDFPLVPGYGDNVPSRDQNAMIAETHVFTPALLNEFRAGFDRVSLGVYQQDIGQNVNAQVGLPTVSTNPRDLRTHFHHGHRLLAARATNPTIRSTAPPTSTS